MGGHKIRVRGYFGDVVSTFFSRPTPTRVRWIVEELTGTRSVGNFSLYSSIATLIVAPPGRSFQGVTIERIANGRPPSTAFGRQVSLRR